MKVQEIGISLFSAGPVRSLGELDQRLDRLSRLGFQLVEINLDALPLILDGRVLKKPLADAAAVLRNHPLRYTVHGFNRLNLAYDPRHRLCRRIMEAQLEVCRAFGAPVLVYHSGLQALDVLRSGFRARPLSDAELDRGARQEVAALRDLAPRAAEAGVTIAVENADPHLWEFDLLRSHGLEPGELLRHHRRLHPRYIARTLEAVDHPNVAMTLDLGHLFLAARTLSFDFLEAVREAAPWVRHLHLNDNFGRLDRGVDRETERWAFGEADLHLPPGWGRIPLRPALEALGEAAGFVVLEIKSGFRDYLAEALKAARRLLRPPRQGDSKPAPGSS